MAGEADLPIEGAAPAPANDAAPAAVEPVVAPHPHEVPTLLETTTNEAPKAEAAPEPVKEEVKAPEPAKDAAPAPVQAAKAEIAKPEEAKAEAPKPEASPNPIDFTNYEFKFADNVKPEETQLKAFREAAMLDKLTPERAQGYVDLFNNAASNFVAAQQKAQVDTWNDTRAEWRKAAMADREIGGSGHQTAMRAIARMRDQFVSSHGPDHPNYEADAKEFNDFLRVTGAGDHPAFLKFIHRVAAKFDEPRLPAPNPQPTKTNGQRPSNSLYKQPGARQ